MPNSALAHMAGDGRTISYISLINFGFVRRITPSNRINNELLYLQSALVPGWKFNEYRHIANALTLGN